MVAKISSGSSLYSALAYDHQKIAADNAKVPFTNKIVESQDKNFSIGICTQSKISNLTQEIYRINF